MSPMARLTRMRPVCPTTLAHTDLTSAYLETKAPPGDGGMAFVPLMFQPGEAFQFDFSHEAVEIAGQPMRVDSVTKGIMATCAVQLEMYQAAKNPLMDHDNESVRDVDRLEREEDQKNKTQETLANVLKYRTCSTGQMVPDDLGR